MDMLEMWMQFMYRQDDSVREILNYIGLEFKGIKSSTTRYAHDNSDYSSWILDYTDVPYKHIKEDMKVLENIKIFGKSIFTVTGNGYNTGIVVSMKNITFTAKDVHESIIKEMKDAIQDTEA